MRFLIAFAAVLGYASAGLIAPLVYGASAGDLQAAAIDATVAARDYSRNLHEREAYVEEAVLRANTKAVRKAVETNRHLHEKAYWDSVVASQNYVAAAQSKAAALSGAVAARAAHLAVPVAPLAYDSYGLPAAYGLGFQAW